MFGLAKGVYELSNLSLPSKETNIFIYKHKENLQLILQAYLAIYPQEEKKVELLKQAIKTYEEQIVDEPLLSGNEIMNILNIKPSKQLGIIKNELLKQQLKGKVKTKEEAIDFIKSFHQRLH